MIWLSKNLCRNSRRGKSPERSVLRVKSASQRRSPYQGLIPYEEEDAAALRRAADAMRAGEAGLVVMDCMGFRRKTRDELRGLTGVPVLLANLLVARVIAEACGA